MSQRTHMESILEEMCSKWLKTLRVGDGSDINKYDSRLLRLTYLFSLQFKSKVGNILVKSVSLCINLNIDDTPIVSRSHTHPEVTLSNLSPLNLVSIFRCSSPPFNPVYVRRVNSLVVVCSLSSHRHLFIPLIFGSRFIDS